MYSNTFVLSKSNINRIELGMLYQRICSNNIVEKTHKKIK